MSLKPCYRPTVTLSASVSFSSFHILLPTYDLYFSFGSYVSDPV